MPKESQYFSLPVVNLLFEYGGSLTCTGFSEHCSLIPFISTVFTSYNFLMCPCETNFVSLVKLLVLIGMHSYCNINIHW